MSPWAVAAELSLGSEGRGSPTPHQQVSRAEARNKPEAPREGVQHSRAHTPCPGRDRAWQSTLTMTLALQCLSLSLKLMAFWILDLLAPGEENDLFDK